MDADFSHDPAYLPPMIEAAAETPTSCSARGTSRAAGSATGGRLRRLVSRGGCWYARIGARRARARPDRRLQVLPAGGAGGDRPATAIRSQGYAFQVELTYRAIQRGFRVMEIPIVFTDRRVGQSKMSRRIVLEAMWMVPRLRRRPGRRRCFTE